LGEIGPFFRQVVERKNSGNRTYRHASAAVDAFHRVDIEHLLALEFLLIFLRVNAIYRAGVDAGSVLRSNAWFGNYVSHLKSDLYQYLNS
jgi:hypothetical protein